MIIILDIFYLYDKVISNKLCQRMKYSPIPYYIQGKSYSVIFYHKNNFNSGATA